MMSLSSPKYDIEIKFLFFKQLNFHNIALPIEARNDGFEFDIIIYQSFRNSSFDFKKKISVQLSCKLINIYWRYNYKLFGN